MFEPDATEGPLTVERKLVGDADAADTALALLATHCRPDPEHPTGLIRSIYFDTPDLRAGDEKANGDTFKCKVRIRWYGGHHEARATHLPVFIEIKQRIGAARRKLRLAVTAPAAPLLRAPLDDPFFGAFLLRHASVAAPALCPHGLAMLCIGYERRRYLCPHTGSRVAFDRHIGADRIHPLLAPALGPLRLRQTICEYKNPDGAPPPWLEALYRLGYRLRSFSKYGECLGQVCLGGAPA